MNDRYFKIPGPTLSRFFWLAISLYILVLPIGGTVALRSLAFICLLVATCILIFRTKCKPIFPIAGAWLCYGAVSLASLMYSLDFDYSLRNVQAEIGYGILIFVVATTWSYRIASVHGIGRAVVLGCALMVAFSFWLGIQGSIKPGRDVSLNAGAGNYSTYLVTVLPIVALGAFYAYKANERRYLSGLVLLIAGCIGALLLTQNRQCFVALECVLFFNLVMTCRGAHGKRNLTLFATGMVLVALVASISLIGRSVAELNAIKAIEGVPATSQPVQAEPSVEFVQSGAVGQLMSADIRWELWRFSFERMLEHPLTGGGFGREAFDLMYHDFHEAHPQIWHAHNMVVNKGVQMGFPGVISFLALWAALTRQLWRYLDSPLGRPLALAGLSIMIGVFVKNMTDDFFVRDGALLFWLLMGTIIGSLQRLSAMERTDDDGSGGRLSR